MDKLVSVFNKIDTLLKWLGGLCIICMMLLVSADAMGRYLLKKPINIEYDVVTGFLMIGVVYLGLPAALKSGTHIRVKIVIDRLPLQVQTYVNLVADIIMWILFALLSYESVRLTWRSFVNHQLYSASIQYPLYLSYGIVSIGFVMALIRQTIMCVSSASSRSVSEDTSQYSQLH